MKHLIKRSGIALLLIIVMIFPLFSACEKAPVTTAPEGTPAAASEWTIKANEEDTKGLDFSNEQDFADAQRGFIATLPDGVIKNADGSTAFSTADFDFEKQPEAPSTVNPLLWRQARLNLNNGLFQVTDRIYQIRSLDLSNMTIVEGEGKIIIIDPMSTPATARAGLDLYYQYRGEKPVAAVIYTHSHLDHFGGVKGVISEEDVASNGVQVIASEGFFDYAISENVMAGTAMSRRAQYMYGIYLPRNDRGMVDIGLGKADPIGTATIIAPTKEIKATGETLTIDGVNMVFQIVSGTEAPTEMTIYFPQFRAFDSAEIACPLVHNILTLRGAQVRDANKWANCINEAIELYGDKTDVLFAQHNWPRWGTEQIITFLEQQRDLYKYTNDQTLRLLNEGYTPAEIAETIKLPDSLASQWYTRNYYGTLKHNVKAVYQRYLGWYDGNPANLDPLPPVEAGKKYVDYMGGPDTVIAMAKKDFDRGEYRWVAQVMNNVVFAYPDNQEARNLEADAMEQLGYQAESGTWRNAYLVGASELRHGIGQQPVAGSKGVDMIKGMTLPMCFDLMGIMLNGPKAGGKHIIINWDFTDTGEKYVLNLQNSSLTYTSGKLSDKADVTVTLQRATLNSILTGATTFEKEYKAKNITIDGSIVKLLELMGMMDSFSPGFNIVTP
jgi:alkyl sulfatase BDS1-like metallo-beta-lactamase superfamily hydrolase